MTMYLGLLTLLAAVQARPHRVQNSSPGCSATGFPVDSTGHITRTLPSGRTYLLYVPPEYDASASQPVVLSFHGAGGTSAKQEKLSQFSTPGLQIAGLPIIAAYPQGADNKAQKRTGVWYSAPYANSSVDDVQFAKDVVADISDNYCTDPTRIYVTGKSNGGGFTAYLACRDDTSKLFAAFAPISPALYPGTLAFSGCSPSRPVPIINSHGVVDQTIPFLGRDDADGTYGTGVATINVPLWRRQWAQRNGCKGFRGGLPLATTVSYPYDDTTEYEFDCLVDFKGFTVSNLGHSWPTTEGLDSSGAPNNTASFDITPSEIVPFFTKYSLPKRYLRG